MLTGFSTIEVSKGGVDLTAVTVVPGTEFIVNSTLIVTLEQFKAMSSLVSVTGMGKLTINLTDSEVSTGALAAFLNDTSAQKPILIGAEVTIKNAAGQTIAAPAGLDAISFPGIPGLQAEIEALVANLSTLTSGAPAAFDTLKEIATKLASLDSSVSALQSLTGDGGAVDTRLAAIESAISDATDTLAAKITADVGALETKLSGTLVAGDLATLKALSDAVKALQAANANGGAVDTRFDAIEAKLAGITDTVVAKITADVGALETKLSGTLVAGDLSTLKALSDAVKALQAANGDGGSVDTRIDAIEAKLAGITDTVVAKITADVGALETKLSGDLVAGDLSTLKALSDAVKALQSANGDGGAVDTRIDAIEAQLAGITDTVVAKITADVGALETKLSGDLVAGDLFTLKALSDAVKALQAANGDGGTVDTRFDALETQLAGITDTVVAKITADVGALETKLSGDLVAGDLSTLKALSDAVKALQSANGDGGTVDLRFDAIEAKLAGITDTVVAKITADVGALETKLSGDLVAGDYKTLKALSDAVNALQVGTGDGGIVDTGTAAQIATLSFDSNDSIGEVEVTGSHVANVIDLTHIPVGGKITFLGRSGDETVILPEGKSGDGVGVYDLEVALSDNAGNDNFVFYGGPDSGDKVVVTGKINFATGNNTLTLVGTVDMSAVAVTSTSIRFAQIKSAVSNDDKFVFVYNGTEYTATVAGLGVTPTDAAIRTAIQAAVDTALPTAGGTALGSGKITVSLENTSNVLFASVDQTKPFETAGRFENADGNGAVTFGFGNFSVVAKTGSASAITISPQTVSLISGLVGDGTTDLVVQNPGENREVVDLSYFDLAGIETIKVGSNVTVALSLEQAARITILREDTDTVVADNSKIAIKLTTTELTGDLDLTNGTYDEVVPSTKPVDGKPIYLVGGVLTIPEGVTLTVDANDLNGVTIQGGGNIVLVGTATPPTDLSNIGPNISVDLSNVDLSGIDPSYWPPEPEGGYVLSAVAAAKFALYKDDPATEANEAANLTVTIKGYGDPSQNADLSKIGTVTFLSSPELVVPKDRTLTLTSEQANGLTVSGAGSVDISNDPILGTLDITHITAGLKFLGDSYVSVGDNAATEATGTVILTENQLMAIGRIFLRNDATVRVTEVTGTKNISGQIDFMPGTVDATVIAQLIDADVTDGSPDGLPGYFDDVGQFQIQEGRTLDLPPSEWPNFYFRNGHEGGMEWQGSTKRIPGR